MIYYIFCIITSVVLGIIMLNRIDEDSDNDYLG
jgi:hypothetical protein